MGVASCDAHSFRVFPPPLSPRVESIAMHALPLLSRAFSIIVPLAIAQAALAFGGPSQIADRLEADAASASDPSFKRLFESEPGEIDRDRSNDKATFTLGGLVHKPDGTPADGAVVVSSVGGQAVTDVRGEFRLVVRAPGGVTSVRVMAVAGGNGNLLASRQVAFSGTSGYLPVPSLQLTNSDSCVPSWLPTFGARPGANGTIQALAVFDDGTSPALYAGGIFSLAGGVSVSRVGRWDGSAWSAVGGDVLGPVTSLQVFDDGSGSALFAGGYFSSAGGVPANRIAKWDGSTWSAVGSGVSGLGFSIRVDSLAVFDDGGGAALYAGGHFTDAGGVPANRIAKWDGSNWSALGVGIGGIDHAATVESMVVFDDGNGARLIAGGLFSTAGGAAANFIAAWDGASWAPLGVGTDSTILTLAVFDAGGGPELYAGGVFTTAGGVPARGIARWDSAGWSALGNGLNDSVSSLAVFDDGIGMRLFASGSFFLAGSVAAMGSATWDGTTWAAAGSRLNGGVRAMAAFDDGSGGGVELFAGGGLASLPGATPSNFSKWNGSSWTPVGRGLNGTVAALAVFDDGTGTALFAGGDFVFADGVTMNGIAKWNGASWSPLGNGMRRQPGLPGVPLVAALAVFDDGTGAALYAGGSFRWAGSEFARGIAKWDGTAWAKLGNGSPSGQNGQPAYFNALVVFDDGNGEALVAGGSLFSVLSGVLAKGIAKWDGMNWTSLGAGVEGTVSALAVYDDGGGAALYAGGVFTSAGTVPTDSIARWDGSNWEALGGGLSNTAGMVGVQALTVFDDGGGSRLYVGGNLEMAGGVPASRLASWNGSNWFALGTGLTLANPFPAKASALGTFDDGTGPRLIVGGTFSSAGGAVASSIAKWDGTSWAPLDSGVFGNVSALAVFDDGNGDALYAGGVFSVRAPGSLGGTGDSFLAKWGCRAGFTNDLCNGDGGDQMGCTDCPCSNNASPGTVGGCINSAGDSTRIAASGDTSASLPTGVATDLRFTLSGAPTGAVCIMFSGSAVAPQNMMNACLGMTSGVQALDREGLRCAVLNLKRHGSRAADVAGEIMDSFGPSRVWGGEAQPNGGLWKQGGFVAGQTRFFQATYREGGLLGCMRGLNTSQAVEVVFTP